MHPHPRLIFDWGSREMIRAVRAYERVENYENRRHIFSVLADDNSFEYIFATDKNIFDSTQRVELVFSKVKIDRAFLNVENYLKLAQMKFDDYIFSPSFEVESFEIAAKGERICLDFGHSISFGEPTEADEAKSEWRVATINEKYPELKEYYAGRDANPEIVREGLFAVSMATIGMTNPQFAYQSASQRPALEYSGARAGTVSSNFSTPQDRTSHFDMGEREMIPISLVADDLKLAIEISHCDEIPLALKKFRHPCHLVASSQNPAEPGGRQLADAWSGGLATGRVLFISPSAAINEDPSKKREDFPTQSWSLERAGEYFTHKFDQSRQPIICTFRHPTKPDFLTRSLDGRYRGGVGGSHRQQKSALGIHERAVELLGDHADPQLDYAVTDIVHCKSTKGAGALQASTHCLNKWMDRTLELSPANLIVVLGAKSRSWFALRWLMNAPKDFGYSVGYEELSPIARAKRDMFVEKCGDRNRVVLFNGHPTFKGLRVLQDVYGKKVLGLLQEFADGSVEVPSSTQELHHMIKVLNKAHLQVHENSADSQIAEDVLDNAVVEA